MNEMFIEIEFSRAYIDDLLVNTKFDWSDNLDKFELLIKSLEQTGLSAIKKGHTFDKPIWNIWVSGWNEQGSDQ